MIKFLSLTIRNFLSYGNNTTVVQLDQPGTTLIVGDDLDNTLNGQGANGVGKAMPLHTEIQTPNGWVTMGEIKYGDFVTTPDGGSAPVIGVFPQGIRPVYNVVLEDGRSAEADEEHIWTTVNHGHVTTNKLRALILSGEVVEIPSVVHPTITPTVMGLPVRTFGEMMRGDLDGPQHEIADMLMANSNTESGSRFIPYHIDTYTAEHKAEILAGAFDVPVLDVTEGTVYTLVTPSAAIAEVLVYITRSLGGKGTVSSSADGLYVVNAVPTRTAGIKVASVERINDQVCQCIMIGHRDHMYITKDFVATHNTVMINALAYCLYDKPISNISKDNLINNINKKHMEVTVTFEKDGMFYHIVRARGMKAGASGNYVKFYKRADPTEFTDADELSRDNKNTNKLIESVVGIPYELFVRIVVFSANHTPFLDLPVRHPTQPSQTSLIEHLFELTELANDAECLKGMIRDAELELNRMKDRISIIDREHKRHDEHVVAAKNRVVSWEQQRDQTIESLTMKLAKIDNVDVDAQQQLHTELKAKQTELTGVLDAQRKVETAIKAAGKLITKARGDQSHLVDDKCPYCLQSFHDTAAKLAECETIIADNTALIEQLSAELESIDEQIEGLSKAIRELKAGIVIQNVDELVDIRNQSANIREKIEELQESTNPYLEPLDELEAVELEAVDYESINQLTTTIEHQKFLMKLLTRKDSFVRKALLNKNVPFLNSRLQEYLRHLGLPHTVQFTHELEAEISQFGRKLDFGNLSNGQRARVNLALSFAFRDVLQKIHARINVCMLDEVLDVGLDTVGVQAAAKMLKVKAREEGISLYVISHRDEIADSAFDRRMIIQLSKGFSYVKDEQ